MLPFKINSKVLAEANIQDDKGLIIEKVKDIQEISVKEAISQNISGVKVESKSYVS